MLSHGAPWHGDALSGSTSETFETLTSYKHTEWLFHTQIQNMKNQVCRCELLKIRKYTMHNSNYKAHQQ